MKYDVCEECPATNKPCENYSEEDEFRDFFEEKDCEEDCFCIANCSYEKPSMTCARMNKKLLRSDC